MLRDENEFLMPERFVTDENTEEEDVREQYINDDFDDVFGSAPPSPTPRDLEDSNHDREISGNGEYSDVPRLKEKHETEGYRDGVTEGKAESVQAGFDEGYGLGAVLGLKIGKILGLLEGIYSAVKSAEGEEWEGEKKRTENLFEEAKKELGTQNVFAREWWGEDGIWKFEVPGEGEGKEVVFEDVAKAHPLMKKWQGVVDGEVERWGLDMGIMDGQHEDDSSSKEIVERKSATTSKEVASEPVTGVGNIMGVSKADLNW